MHTQTLQVTLRCLLQGLEEMGRRGGGQGDWGQLRKLGLSGRRFWMDSRSHCPRIG